MLLGLLGNSLTKGFTSVVQWIVGIVGTTTVGPLWELHMRHVSRLSTIFP